MASLANKNIVVMGGTAGIGLAIAQMASVAGANVWALGRSSERIDAAKAQSPETIHFAAIDTHDSESLKALFTEIGHIDHLAANATGANRTVAPFMEQTHEQFSEAFGKFWGYTTLIRTAVPFMGEGGSITLTSGTPARKCQPGMSSISCVGNAVEGLTRALAPELAPIRVNVVAPGAIDTPMHAWMGADKDKRLGAMTAKQAIARPGKPEEVAGAIIYLMTADYVTGTTIDVDGGQLLP